MLFFDVLRRPHLAVLWLSQVLSSAGDNLYNVAVIWIAVRVAGGGAGLVIAAGTVTRIVLGLAGGSLADRLDRRRALIGSDLIRAAAVASLPLIDTFGGIALWHLAVVAIVLAALGTLFDPTLQASLPSLVDDPSHLLAINGLMDGTRRIALATAPSLAGLLVALVALPQFFTIDAVSFLISALAVISIGRHFRPRPSPPATPLSLRAVLDDMRETLHLVNENLVLRWFLASQALSNVAWAAGFQVGVALLSDRVLHRGVGGYGLILGAYGAGNVLSNFVVGNIRVNRPLALLLASRLMHGTGFAIVALSHSLPVAMAGAALAATGGPMGDLMLLGLIHRDYPSHQIGKVYSMRMTIANVGVSAGLLLAGPLYAVLPIAAVIGMASALMFTTAIVSYLRFGLAEPVSVAV